MTVNKFGNYLHYKTESHRLSMAVGVPPRQPSISFKSVCILSIRGTSNVNTLKYTLENGLQSYEFKITGKIEEVDVSTDLALLSLNGENPIPPKDLIGVTINKGDTLVILENRSIGKSPSVFIQFILLCPIINDE